MAKGFDADAFGSAQQSFRERYLAESTSVQCKAAILSVADKWSIKDLQQSVASIQDRLMTVALNTEETSANRIVAWEQAIRLLPDSPRIVTAVEGLFTPQLSPELGNQALDALQTARAEGLAAKLLEVRKRVGPTLASGILRVLLAALIRRPNCWMPSNKAQCKLLNCNWISDRPC